MIKADYVNRMVAIVVALAASTAWTLAGSDENADVGDDVIATQRNNLANSTLNGGFGPQSPRDIYNVTGANSRLFGMAPAATAMNLCNIHFHESAEHKGGEFTTYRGNGDGHGFGSGYVYDRTLSEAEKAPFGAKVGATEHGDLQSGDTIEIHFVHTSAHAKPGPTLGACVSEAIGNPNLRVETVVAVLVNDRSATDFMTMAKVELVGGLYQVPNLPTDLGTPVSYAGSTTGPGYNEKASPFHVTWSVRPKVVKIDIGSVAKWLESNEFNEDHAHGVRNLVVNPDLL